MQDVNFISVVKKDAAFFGSNQKMARGYRQDRGDGARIGILRKDLSKAPPIERQQPVLRRGDDQFLLTRIGQDYGRNSDKRRRR